MEEKKISQQNLIIVSVIAILIVGAGSFYGGMKYQSSKTPQFGLQNGARAGQFAAGARGAAGAAGRMRGTGFTAGEVLKQDATSVTVKTVDGGSKTIYLTDATTIGKEAAGSKTDLATGVNITVNGNANPDGSIAATSIQIRPAGSTIPGGQPNASGTPASNLPSGAQGGGSGNIPGNSRQ